MSAKVSTPVTFSEIKRLRQTNKIYIYIRMGKTVKIFEEEQTKVLTHYCAWGSGTARKFFLNSKNKKFGWVDK